MAPFYSEYARVAAPQNNSEMKDSPSFELRKWLDGLGLGQYASAMEAQDITLEVLPQLSEEDLKECGVTSIGHRRILKAAILALQVQPPSQTAVDANPAIASESGGADSPLGNENAAENFVSSVEEPVPILGHPENLPEEQLPYQPVPEVRLSEPHEAVAQENVAPVIVAPIAVAIPVPIAASGPAQHEPPHSQISAQVAAVPKLIVPTERLSVFARIRRGYRKASGGSLLLSIGVHAIIILIGTYLVVSQVVEDRKISFGGGDRRQSAEPQHKVKMKARPATAPAPNKRITTTSSIAKVALPDMPNVQVNMGPSLAASMGSGGFGSVASLGGAPSGGGGKEMNFAKITFFGLRGAAAAVDGFVGTFYDFKQTPGRRPTVMALDNAERLAALARSPKADPDPNKEYASVLRKFCVTWDLEQLKGYYKAKEKLMAYQVFIPPGKADEAPKAFGVEKEVKPTRWIVYYEAMVLPPKTGRYRFRGRADDVLLVRWDGQLVYDGSLPNCFVDESVFKEPKWIEMKRGVPIKMEVIIGEQPGGFFFARLLIEHDPGANKPPEEQMVFQLKKAAVTSDGDKPVPLKTMVFGVQAKPVKPAYGPIGQ